MEGIGWNVISGKIIFDYGLEYRSHAYESSTLASNRSIKFETNK